MINELFQLAAIICLVSGFLVLLVNVFYQVDKAKFKKLPKKKLKIASVSLFSSSVVFAILWLFWGKKSFGQELIQLFKKELPSPEFSPVAGPVVSGQRRTHTFRRFLEKYTPQLKHLEEAVLEKHPNDLDNEQKTNIQAHQAMIAGWTDKKWRLIRKWYWRNEDLSMPTQPSNLQQVLEKREETIKPLITHYNRLLKRMSEKQKHEFLASYALDIYEDDTSIFKAFAEFSPRPLQERLEIALLWNSVEKADGVYWTDGRHDIPIQKIEGDFMNMVSVMLAAWNQLGLGSNKESNSERKEN